MNDIVVQAQGIQKSFIDGERRVDVLKSVDLCVRRGECVAILGPSGSGKSTFLHILGGLEQASAGEIVIAGNHLKQLSEVELCGLRNQELGFVYQFHHLLPEFSALENVAMPLLIRGVDIADAEQAAQALLEQVGLAQRSSHKLNELSGGERQRTAFARALVTQPSCVFADEPTGNLDTQTAEKVYSIMLELNRKQNTSFVLVTHDRHLADRMDRVLSLENGILNEQ